MAVYKDGDRKAFMISKAIFSTTMINVGWGALSTLLVIAYVQIDVIRQSEEKK